MAWPTVVSSCGHVDTSISFQKSAGLPLSINGALAVCGEGLACASPAAKSASVIPAAKSVGVPSLPPRRVLVRPSLVPRLPEPALPDGKLPEPRGDVLASASPASPFLNVSSVRPRRLLVRPLLKPVLPEPGILCGKLPEPRLLVPGLHVPEPRPLGPGWPQAKWPEPGLQDGTSITGTPLAGTWVTEPSGGFTNLRSSAGTRPTYLM